MTTLGQFDTRFRSTLRGVAEPVYRLADAGIGTVIDTVDCANGTRDRKPNETSGLGKRA